MICAKIGLDKTDFGDKIKWKILKDNYTKQDFEEFCTELDFEYDNGYGTQELFGIILFADSYSTRYEYDGSENWENHKMLTIQEVLTFA